MHRSVSRKAMAGALLLALSLILLGWGAEGQGNEGRKLKVPGSSAVWLGQNGHNWSPLLHVAFNLSEIGSIKSSFQFRTFDPEGVIFYGDTKNGEDWFVLSLKEGVPLMQISKEDVLISVAGAPKLNDGKWHTLEVSNQGRFVILEVDGSGGLVVGIQSKPGEMAISGLLRLALGGIQIAKERMIVQFNPQMDGCVQNGNWLNHSTQWTAEVDKLWPCYANIQPGSYFPGTGFAIFNTSDFHIDEDEGFQIELWGDFSQMSGTIFTMKDYGQYIMSNLVADNNTKVITLTFGDTRHHIKESLKRLHVLFEKEQVHIHYQHQSETTESVISAENFTDYLTAWKDARLAFGTLLGESEDGGRAQFLTGCLKKIQVQGKDLDLDSADVKHISVSSHSCPA